MPDPGFTRKKRQERAIAGGRACRYCGRRCGTPLVVVQYEQRWCLCEWCLHRYAMHNGRLDLSTYWSRDWPAD